MNTAEKVLEIITESEKDGDVYQRESAIVARCLAAYPYLTESHILEALMELSANGNLLHVDDAYAITETGSNEEYLARQCTQYIFQSAPFNPFDVPSAVRDAEAYQGIQLSPSQRSAAIGGLQARLAIISGGPGSGKTTMLRVLCDAAELAMGSEIVLMAPTGKAARRMAEQTGREASTIHSLAYTSRGVRRYGDGCFSPKLIVVDEASMLSISLLADLLRAVSPVTRIVLVGDPDQLPAVGPGRVLADLMASGLPVHRLTDNFRQASGGCLAQSIGYIRDGRTNFPQTDPSIQLLETLSSYDAEMLALSIYSSRVMEGQNVQLLSPVGSAGGVCSTVSLNARAQEMVNPPRLEKLEVWIGETLFRLGDKVIQCRNNEYARNGDVGRILRISNANGEIYITIQFDFGGAASYTCSEIQESQLLDLAYALTVHKAQGSEYDSVIVPLVLEHRNWTRNMIYTAASRAKKELIMVGTSSVLTQAITTPLPKRDTRLLERIMQLRQQAA